MAKLVNAALLVLALGALVAAEFAGVELSEYLKATLAAVVGWALPTPRALAEKLKR